MSGNDAPDDDTDAPAGDRDAPPGDRPVDGADADEGVPPVDGADAADGTDDAPPGDGPAGAPSADEGVPPTAPAGGTGAPPSATGGDALYFGYATAPPTDWDVTVYDSHGTELGGFAARFDVIGASHRVSVPAADFHELASCRAPPDTDGPSLELPLEVGIDRRVTFEATGLACETVVRTVPGHEVPAAPDLEYAFSPAARTAVAVRTGAAGYDTYHTYPEHDLTVLTGTALEFDGAVGDAHADGGSDADAGGDGPDRGPETGPG